MSDKTARWIDRKYLEWQAANGRSNLDNFAAHLGVSVSTLNNWIYKKQTPKGESLNLLARKLGPEIYDLAGMERPDPMIDELNQLFSRADGESKAKILGVVRDILGINETTERHR